MSGLGRAGTAALAAGLASLSLAQAVLLSMLGPVMRDIGLMEWQTGAVISAGALTAAVAAPVWGRMSDRQGPRGVFVLAIAAGVVTTAATGVVLAAGQGGLIGAEAVFLALLLVRVVYAAVGSGAFPAAAGVIGDTVAPEKRTGGLAMTGTAFGAGSLAGAAAVFVLGETTGVWGPLAVAVLIGVMALALAVRSFPETRPSTSPTPERRSVRGIGSLLVAAVLIFTGAAMVSQAVPFLVQDRGALELGEAVSRAGLLAFVMSAVTLAALALVQRSNPAPGRLARIGGLVAASSAAMIAIDAGLAGLLAALLGLGAALGALTPALQGLVSLRVSPERQAAAAGALSAATVSGFVLGPFAGGLLYEVAPFAPFLGAAASIGLGWAFVARTSCGMSAYPGE